MRMTAKINTLVISVGLLLSLALTGLTAFREYRIDLRQLLADASSRLSAHPELQLACNTGVYCRAAAAG